MITSLKGKNLFLLSNECCQKYKCIKEKINFLSGMSHQYISHDANCNKVLTWSLISAQSRDRQFWQTLQNQRTSFFRCFSSAWNRWWWWEKKSRGAEISDMIIMLCHCMLCHYVDIITVIQPLYLSYSSVGIRIVRVKELHYDLGDIIRDSWFCWYLSKDGNLCFFYCTLFRFTMLSCCQRQNDQPQIKFT